MWSRMTRLHLEGGQFPVSGVAKSPPERRTSVHNNDISQKKFYGLTNPILWESLFPVNAPSVLPSVSESYA
jgi:hypothetical protein